MTDLSREDVQQILDLIEKSEFDYFELQSGDLKLTVSKTGMPHPGQAVAPPSAPAAPSVAAPANAPASPPPAPAVAAQPPASSSAAVEPARAAGTIPVKAPMVGTFFGQSEPGAPPYVEIGSHVERDTTMGLIEVMKVFTAVFPPVSGTVEAILTKNAEFVEFGQDLFLIRPDDPASA